MTSNAEVAEKIRKKIPCWNINGLAAYVLRETVINKSLYQSSFSFVIKDREYMFQALQSIPGLRVFPSQANFLYCHLPSLISGKWLRLELLNRYGLYIRECSNKVGSSESFLRIAVTPKLETDVLSKAMNELISEALNGQVEIA